MNYSDLITLILTQLRDRVNSDQFLEQFLRPKTFVRHRKLSLKQAVAIHPERFYERSKMNRGRRHLHTRKSVF